MAKQKVYIIGVGMSKFLKPSPENHFPDYCKEAITNALSDANINYSEVKQAVAGYVFGGSCSGQRALYEVGMTGIPCYNVNNNCGTGSSTLYLAKQLIDAGESDCILAFGFEKMDNGPVNYDLTKVHPLDNHIKKSIEFSNISDPGPPNVIFFSNAADEHMRKYGTKPKHFAKIALKNHKHSVHNPYSQIRDEYTIEQIMSSRKIHGVLTKLQCCPLSDGAAACILANESFVRKNKLEKQAVEIIGMEMASDLETTFKDKSCIKVAGFDLTKLAKDKLFSKTTYKLSDVDVVELHDCFSANELLTYEALGLCPVGKAGEFIDRGDNTYGGKYVINPSGGLISKGHPFGATGVSQCVELCWHLRGLAEKRQVPNCKLALSHNIGIGGVAVVGLYRLGF